jgi:hypothetical protein
MDVQLLAALGVALVLAGIAAILAHAADAPTTVRPPTPDTQLPADPVRIAKPRTADVFDDLFEGHLLASAPEPADGGSPG